MGELVWDLEAACAIDKDDPDRFSKSGVSIACVLDLETYHPSFYSPGDKDEFSLLALAERLESADAVVSYWGEGYDNHVLGWAIGRKGPIQLKRSIDVCQAIFTAKNGLKYPKGSWGLGRVAERTIGMGKLEVNGEKAPTMWDQGKFGEVTTYNYRDVLVLAKLYEHIKRTGYVLDPMGQRLEVRFQ